MPKPIPISVLAVAIVSSWLPRITVPAWSQTLTSDSQRRPQNSDPSPSRQPPSPDEIRARVKNLIANQHKNDMAEAQYEWVERHVDQTSGANPRTLNDRTIRLVPNGAGATKIILAENGKSTDPAELRRQLQNAVQVLQMMIDSDDPRMKTASAKYQKRMRDRAELVDSVSDAFVVTWQRQEMRGGTGL